MPPMDVETDVKTLKCCRNNIVLTSCGDWTQINLILAPWSFEKYELKVMLFLWYWNRRVLEMFTTNRIMLPNDIENRSRKSGRQMEYSVVTCPRVMRRFWIQSIRNFKLNPLACLHYFAKLFLRPASFTCFRYFL